MQIRAFFVRRRLSTTPAFYTRRRLINKQHTTYTSKTQLPCCPCNVKIVLKIDLMFLEIWKSFVKVEYNEAEHVGFDQLHGAPILNVPE